jgi:hypothetical protein
MGVGGKRHAPAALPPGKGNGTQCIRGWVGPRAGLDGCGKSRPHRDFLFILCTLSLLACPDCPCFAFRRYYTTHTTLTSMPPAGFKYATPASGRP